MMNYGRCRESGMILFSLLIEKLNSWRSWHLGESTCRS